MRDQTKRREHVRRMRSVAFIFAIVGLLPILGVIHQNTPDFATGPVATGQIAKPGADRSPPREAAWAALRPRLEKADREAREALTRALAQVNDYIDGRKGGAKPFAVAVLGFEAKVAAVDSQLDRVASFVSGLFGSAPPEDDYYRIPVEGNRLDQFVRERFEAMVLSRWELQKVVQSAIAGYVADVQAIENRLLVDIRADLGDDALAELIPELRGDDLLHERYDALLRDVASTSGTDLQVEIAREAVSWVGGDIATAATIRVAEAIATELGISGGVLSAGAGSTVATLGVGLIVSWIVDEILGEIMRLAGYDAKGDIVTKVEAAVEQTRLLIMHGANHGSVQVAEQRGLIGELQRLHEARARLRTDAIHTLILGGGQ